MLWLNGCNAMLKWEKSRKSTKVAYGSHTDICKINESCTRSYKTAVTVLLTNLHLKLLSTQGTGADKLLSTQRYLYDIYMSSFHLRLIVKK